MELKCEKNVPPQSNLVVVRTFRLGGLVSVTYAIAQNIDTLVNTAAMACSIITTSLYKSVFNICSMKLMLFLRIALRLLLHCKLLLPSFMFPSKSVLWFCFVLLFSYLRV